MSETKATDVVIPRPRYEAMARQVLALREQLDSLSLLMQSELQAQPAPKDPRTETPPSTFGRRSA